MFVISDKRILLSDIERKHMVTKDNKKIIYQYMYNFLDKLENVKLNFGPVDEKQKHPLEQVYLHNIFKNLTKWSDFNNYEYYLISARYLWDFPIHDQSVVFYLSNEEHSIPQNLLKAFKIFTPYCPLADVPENCHPIPLGYNGSLSNLVIKPINQRSNEVFFSGNIHRKRLPFYFGANKFLIQCSLSRFFKNKVNLRNQLFFTHSFGGGFAPEKYSNMLMDSKIALAPEGYKSDISFRFFEAAKYGNVIITKKLYNYWFFRDFPGIQVDNWFHLYPTIKNLIKNPAHLYKIHLETLDYYDRFLTEEAVAAFIVDIIENH